MSEQISHGKLKPLQWCFARPGNPQRQRNSKLDDHFAGSGSDRAGDLGREGAQNAGDAGLAPAAPPVRIRIGFGELAATQARFYVAGLVEHAPDIAKQKGMAQVLTVVGPGPCPYLSFEDFNTTGLTGDPHLERRYDGDAPNAFHTFFRAEGQTDKDNSKKQGSHGIGKVAFMSASFARAVLGLTCRHDDNRELLFGTAVLHTHRHAGKDFDGDAWFGRINDQEGVDPAEDAATLAQFRSDFHLARKPGEPGFSVVVPWLNREEVEPSKVIDSVLRAHVLPILRGDLVVEIANEAGKPDTVIDATHFLTVLETREDKLLKSQVKPVAELAAWALANMPTASATLSLHAEGAPRWTSSNLMSASQRDEFRSAFDADKPVAIRVPVRVKPKSAAEIISHFDVFLHRETTSPNVPGPTVQYVRGGLLITGMGKRLPGVRALVTVEDSGLAGMLRAAENPSHTRWNAKAIKESYQLHTSTVSFVIESVKELVKLLAGDPAEKDGSIWATELSVSAGVEKGMGAGSEGKGRAGTSKDDDEGKKAGETKVKPLPAKRPYLITENKGGFVIKPSGKPFPRTPSEENPVALELQLAYFVRGKNPLSRWSPNDFDLADTSKISLDTVRGCSIETRDGKRLVLKINNVDFEFSAGGFDKYRELFCQPRLEKPPGVTQESDSDADEPVESTIAAVEGGAA